MRIALGAGLVAVAASVTCSMAKLPDSTKGSATDASANETRTDRKPARRRNGPLANTRLRVVPLLSMRKVSLTAALVVLISTAMSPLMATLAPLPVMVVL